MRSLTVLLLIALAGVIPALGQAGVSLRTAPGVRMAALGGAGVALWGAGLSNPAAGASLPGPEMRLYADRAFGVPELQLVAAQAQFPTRLATLRLDAGSFGYEEFRAVHVALGVARGLRLGTTRTVQTGLLVGYHHVALGSDYGTAGAVRVDAGMRTALTPRLSGGVQAVNLLRARLAGREPLPRSLSIGMAFAVADRVTVAADVSQEVRAPTRFSAGVEAHVAGPLTMRAGAGSGPQQLALGFGVAAGRLAAAAAFTRHEALGWTPAVELGIGF
jgi:hypothetical protein